MSEYKNKYIFWMDDPTVLYTNNNYTRFIPSFGMSRVEQLNAIARFCLYGIFLLFIFGRINSWLYVPIIGLIFTVVLYNIYQYDPDGRQKELFSERTQKFDEQQDKGILEDGKEYDLEAGYYDYSGNLISGDDYDNSVHIKKPIYYTPNELIQYQQNSCKRPTKDNPFANPPVTDFNTSNGVAACNADDVDISEAIVDTFNSEIYRNIDDLFDIKNSQRQFYTNPSTSIPSNREDFQNWLYRIDYTCKENSEKCLRDEDLRFKR
jgi:hypothetical protein